MTKQLEYDHLTIGKTRSHHLPLSLIASLAQLPSVLPIIVYEIKVYMSQSTICAQTHTRCMTYLSSSAMNTLSLFLSLSLLLGTCVFHTFCFSSLHALLSLQSAAAVYLS